MSCKHRRFWVMGVYAWCPECGALRALRFDKDGGHFSWRRWVKPSEQLEKVRRLLDLNKEGGKLP